jgi:hypothetical protein
VERFKRGSVSFMSQAIRVLGIKSLGEPSGAQLGRNLKRAGALIKSRENLLNNYHLGRLLSEAAIFPNVDDLRAFSKFAEFMLKLIGGGKNLDTQIEQRLIEASEAKAHRAKGAPLVIKACADRGEKIFWGISPAPGGSESEIFVDGGFTAAEIGGFLNINRMSLCWQSLTTW